MPVSLKDISLATGINICSVSQILNNRPAASQLREETRRRVLETARRLGYSRNELAATMANGKSRILALVITDMGTVDYTGRIVNGVLAEATSRNYAVIVYRLGQMTEEEIAGHVFGWRAAGVLFHIDLLSRAPWFMKRLEKEGLLYGLIDHVASSGGIGVTTDNFDGLAQSVQALVRNGRQRLAYVHSMTPPGVMNEPDGFQIKRIEGYRRAAAVHSPESADNVIALASTKVGGRRAAVMRAIRKLRQLKVDGIACESDYVAMELMAGMQEMGIRVPLDCAIIGYGNMFMAQLVNPPLASIAQDYEKIGGLTTRLVIEQIEGKPRKPSSVILPVRLVVRQSLGV